MPMSCGRVALGVGAGADARRGGHKALFLLPAVLFTVAMVIFPTLFGFYIAFTDWNLSRSPGANSTGSTICAHSWPTPISGTRCCNMVFYVAGGAGAICDRLRPGAAAQRRDPGAQILPRRLPPALHAQPGGGELDDRQVDHGIPLRPGRNAGALPGLGKPRLLRLALDRACSASWRWMPGSRFRS